MIKKSNMIKKCFLFLFLLINTLAAGRQHSGGVYSYVNKNSHKVHYVGMTNDFNRRHNEHKLANHYYASPNYELKKTYMTGASRNDMYEEEKRQIKNKHPIANKHPGGNGPK